MPVPRSFMIGQWQRGGTCSESLGCGHRMRSWVAAVFAVVLGAALVGCASVYNLPGNAPLGAALADNDVGREVRSYEDDVLLALSFSGGGMRASAFSFAPLTEL